MRKGKSTVLEGWSLHTTPEKLALLLEKLILSRRKVEMNGDLSAVCGDLTVIPYAIGSPSAPYGAPGLRKRNLGAPRAIRLLIKILTWLILQLSKEAMTALIKFILGLRKLWSISSWAP